MHGVRFFVLHDAQFVSPQKSAQFIRPVIPVDRVTFRAYGPLALRSPQQQQIGVALCNMH
jgi:hypothetical protein